MLLLFDDGTPVVGEVWVNHNTKTALVVNDVSGQWVTGFALGSIRMIVLPLGLMNERCGWVKDGPL